jgi:glycerophosphoryl diester phosphodiesterase
MEFENSYMPEIVALIRKYDAQGHCYFMTSSDKRASEAMAYAPDIPVCLGWDGNQDKMSMVDRALKLGIKKIQLFKPYFDENTVKKAKENGIICNVFWSDDPDETQKFLDWGIDTILSNDYLKVANGVKK